MVFDYLPEIFWCHFHHILLRYYTLKYLHINLFRIFDEMWLWEMCQVSFAPHCTSDYFSSPSCLLWFLVDDLGFLPRKLCDFALPHVRVCLYLILSFEIYMYMSNKSFLYRLFFVTSESILCSDSLVENKSPYVRFLSAFTKDLINLFLYWRGITLFFGMNRSIGRELMLLEVPRYLLWKSIYD